MIGVGVIGLGVMGATHISAYRSAAAAGHACRLVAVCDSDPARRAGGLSPEGNMQGPAGGFDPTTVRAYERPEQLLADADIELVSICTPTDTHVELAAAAVRAGKHVLLEKPIALTVEPIRGLRDEANRAGRLVMPAMCMRFWPAWQWVKSAIDDRRFGQLRAMNLQRVGALPTWSNWFSDVSRSGGASIDLHIHDTDFVRHCLGRPAAVTSAGHVNHISTIYHFDDPTLHVTAQGGWLTPPTPFRMRLIAEFEQATVDFDISRKDQLLVCRGGEQAEAIELSPLTGYDLEVRHVLSVLRDSSVKPQATLDDAVDVAIILETEQYAAECGKRVTITWGVDEPPGH